MKKVLYIFVIIAISLSVFIVIGLREGDKIIKQTYEIKSDKISKDYNIVQISDFHSTRDNTRLKQINDIIKTEKIDLFAITGDYISAPGYKQELDYLIELNKIAPVYYINGNHENDYGEYINFRDDLIKNGIKVVVNDHVAFNEELNILGTESSFDATLKKLGKDDAIYNDILKKDTETFNEHLNKQMYNLVLVHNPAYFEGYCTNKADLVLAGHTHGGLWRIPFVNISAIAPEQGLFPKYDAGLFTCNDGDTKMIISTGLERISAGFRRIYTPSEVVVIKLISDKK